MLTEAGTVATAVLEDVSANVTFDGAGTERLREMF
jgi:hypothetical protein